MLKFNLPVSLMPTIRRPARRILAAVVASSLAACSSARPDPRQPWLDSFSRSAFQAGGDRRIVYPAATMQFYYSVEGRCFEVDMIEGRDFPGRRQLRSGVANSSIFHAVDLQEQKRVHSSAICPRDTPGIKPRLYSHIAYFTDPAAFARAVAERRRDASLNLSKVFPTSGEHGCAIFMTVTNHEVRRADTLVLAPSGQAMELSDKPGTACAVRGASSSVGLMGHLDMSDDELLAPDYASRARTITMPLFRAMVGPFLFWRIPLRPGMSEADALAAVGAHPEFKATPLPALVQAEQGGGR